MRFRNSLNFRSAILGLAALAITGPAAALSIAISDYKGIGLTLVIDNGVSAEVTSEDFPARRASLTGSGRKTSDTRPTASNPDPVSGLNSISVFYARDTAGVATGDSPGSARFGHGMNVVFEIYNDNDVFSAMQVDYSVDWALSATTTLPGEQASAKANLGFVFRIKGGAILDSINMVNEKVLAGEPDWSDTVRSSAVLDLRPKTTHQIILGNPGSIAGGSTGLISEVYALTPIPLPASGFLLLGALFTAVVFRRRAMKTG